MAAFVLSLPESKLRIIAPDVGGGFWVEDYLYAEDVALTWASKKSGGRSSGRASARKHSLRCPRRDHVTKAELAMDADGKFWAFAFTRRPHGRVFVDVRSPIDHPVRHAARRPVRHAAIYAEVKAVLHEHGSRRCLSRRGPSRSDLCARTYRGDGGARDEHRSG